MAFALVLFDVDGCTAIVNSKKLGDPNDLKKGQHANNSLNQEKKKVEVLELSDSKALLNNFEDEWTLTHRSIALDKEKKRRKNKLNGYLDVWPTDMEEATPSEDDSDVEEHEGERNKDDKQPKKNPEIRRTPKTTTKTSESKEKHILLGDGHSMLCFKAVSDALSSFFRVSQHPHVDVIDKDLLNLSSPFLSAIKFRRDFINTFQCIL